MLLIIILLTLVTGANGTWNANITTINNNPGIYFENIGKIGLYSNEWQVIVYYDLTNYYFELTKLNQYIINIRTMCNKMLAVHENMYLCTNIAQQFELILNGIKDRNILLRPQKQKKKRSLFNAVGTLSKTLFGTLNEDDAYHYDDLINELKTNDGHLLNF